MADWNDGIIEEFRANGGEVGGMFEGALLLILHHTGAKSGTMRHSPLVYQALDDGSYAIFASKAGSAENPAWYHNVKANPQTQIEIGSETVPVTARVATPGEREPIWTKQKADRSNFAEYEAKTDRVIPVVLLERR